MGEEVSVLNVADKEQVKEAGKKDKARRDQEINDMANMLSTESGRRFLWRLLGKCGVYALSYTGSGSDTFFREGGRNVGLFLLDEIQNANVDGFLQMIKENRKDKPK